MMNGMMNFGLGSEQLRLSACCKSEGIPRVQATDEHVEVGKLTCSGE